MHAQPGVYALLLGSGVSTGAGVPTGWGIVGELVSRIAHVAGGEDASAAARANPESWWVENGSGELGYSTLLEALAPTAAARHGLLAEFFEGKDDDDEPVVPSRAHRAIAELVDRGVVRVIVTTNFDRLMERALQERGIEPQVISRPEAVNGMAPLAHSKATIIKLHGDYKDLGTLNTPTELSAYAPEWTTLLGQVFDEYGLVVSGWSAEWDSALVAALEGATSRRYPLYWDARSARHDNATRLLAFRAGTVIPAASADDLFSEMAEALDALDRMSTPPLSTALAVARLKKYLPDPVRRIDLHDLVMSFVEDVVRKIEASPITGDANYADLDRLYEDMFVAMERVTPLLIDGVWHSSGPEHTQLWSDVLQRLLDAALPAPDRWNRAYRGARLIPAFVAFAVMSMTAIARGNEGLMVSLGTRVEAVDRSRGGDDPTPAAQHLHYRGIAEDDWVKELPRWNGAGHFLYPASRLFGKELRRYFTERFQSDADFAVAYAGFEYRLGLLQSLTAGRNAISGEYVSDGNWVDEVPKAEIRFTKTLEHEAGRPWRNLFASHGLDATSHLVAHRARLSRYRRDW